MGLLTPGRALAVGLVALAGCYSPVARDCTVSCASPGDCVSGQVCGSDGLCAAPEVAGRCVAVVTDGGPGHDARPSDASVSADAPSMVSLRVQISGKGSVIVLGRSTCSSLDPQHGNCTYDIVLGVPQVVRAAAIQSTDVFSKWSSATCGGQGATCRFIPVGATTVIAKFDHGGGLQ